MKMAEDLVVLEFIDSLQKAVVKIREDIEGLQNQIDEIITIIELDANTDKSTGDILENYSERIDRLERLIY